MASPGTIIRPGREFVGHTERDARGRSTAYAIEVPVEHATAWLASVRQRFPDAWLQATWPGNSTVMARYGGTPENRVDLDAPPTPSRE